MWVHGRASRCVGVRESAGLTVGPTAGPYCSTIATIVIISPDITSSHCPISISSKTLPCTSMCFIVDRNRDQPSAAKTSLQKPRSLIAADILVNKLE